MSPRASNTNDSRHSAHRVVHVDSHFLCRLGFERLVETHKDPALTLVGQAQNRRDAQSLVLDRAPELVVTALELTGDDGLELVGWLRQNRPQTKVLVLSSRDAATFGERVLRTGALGFVPKDSDAPLLLMAIREVLSGRIYAPPALTERVMSAMTGRRVVTADDPLDMLSDRELQVFEQLGSGRSSREVAQILGLSVKTIASHRANIQVKLGGVTLPELLRRAVLWVEGKEKSNGSGASTARA